VLNPFALGQWGATPHEIAADMAGDEQVREPMFSATRAISVGAPAAMVFPWLRQMGFGRAGWYSYDWIDNFGKESARFILPQWQHVGPGDAIPAGPLSFTATHVEPNRAFCIVQHNKRVQFSLAFELHPETAGTRLVSRARARLAFPGGRHLARWLLEPGDGLMVRKQLLGIKERAESLATAC